MSDPHQEITAEAEIEALIGVAEGCRKVTAAIAGGVLLVLTLTGLLRVAPVALVTGITAVLGSIALFGSHTSTLEQVTTAIKAHEARRVELIGKLDFQNVGVNEGT